MRQLCPCEGYVASTGGNGGDPDSHGHANGDAAWESNAFAVGDTESDVDEYADTDSGDTDSNSNANGYSDPNTGTSSVQRNLLQRWARVCSRVGVCPNELSFGLG